MSNLKEKVAKGAVWTLMEKISCQMVGFVVGMVLARLLTPTDYGTVALTAIFFAVAGVLVDGGFGNALIQPTALICVAEAAVVFGIDFAFNLLGWGFEQTGSIWSLVAVLSAQFIGGSITFFGLAIAYKLNPMCEYARLASSALGSRLPRVTKILNGIARQPETGTVTGVGHLKT